MAATAPGLVPPDGRPPENNFPRLCALLRDIRAEAQNLQKSLAQVQQKAALTDARTRAQEVDAALKEAATVLARNRSQIDERLRQVRGVFDVDPKQYDWCGDEVTEIENNWDRIVSSWPEDLQPEDALRRIPAWDECLDQIVYHCAALTIPSRLNAFLENLRVGQALDFHSSFEDELPKREQRDKVLSDLARQPGVVEGVVDAPNGLVYRMSPNALRRRISPLLLIGVALTGFLLVWLFAGMGGWLNLAAWPVDAKRFPELAIAYLFLLIGGFAHLGVNALKESRSAQTRFVALEDWVLWLHVREGSIVWGIFYLWVGFFGLAWSLKTVNWETAFFAGYSIDSVVDLFLARFEKTAGKKALP